MEIKHKYKNPPLVEVVCEFRFREPDPAGFAIADRVYERLKNRYPGKKELFQFEVGFELKGDDFQQKAVKQKAGFEFSDSVRAELVRVGPDFISVHHLAQYDSWEVFAPQALIALHAFLDSSESKTLQRVGLRYIDKVIIPSTDFRLSEFFTVYPHTAKPMGEGFQRFLVRVEAVYSGGRDLLSFMMFNEPAENPTHTVVILDWDYGLVKPERVPLDRVAEWLSEAHHNVIDAFESSITDRCRGLFDGRSG
jgi:uncharacterized protein (TIGR04255 family)